MSVFFKLLAVIALWFAALQIWDIATLQMRSTLRSVVGALRFAAGCAIGFAALAALYVLLPVPAATFSSLAILTFIAALIAEFLIGDDVRGAVRSALRR